jgi:hypothetical protein
MIKKGDRVKYVGLPHSYFYGEMGTVKSIIGGKVTVVFDDPKFNGGYKFRSDRVVTIVGFLEKRIGKHRFTTQKKPEIILC